jgi:hypothetical protein
MSDLIQEMADVPREFFKDGTQFINRCTKRKLTTSSSDLAHSMHLHRDRLRCGYYDSHHKAPLYLCAATLVVRSSSAHIRPDAQEVCANMPF